MVGGGGKAQEGGMNFCKLLGEQTQHMLLHLSWQKQERGSPREEWEHRVLRVLGRCGKGVMLDTLW